MSPDMDPVAVALRAKKDDMLTRYIAHAKCYGCYRYVALGNLGLRSSVNLTNEHKCSAPEFCGPVILLKRLSYNDRCL